MARGTTALALYGAALRVLSGPMLKVRARRGKEELGRLAERTGTASRVRPQGTLIWIHGASIGESLAVLPLVSALLGEPNRSVLVTTGTVTSAKLMAERLPPRAFHQYLPLDAKAYVKHFLEHWRPDLALFVESELWPNLILETQARGVPMALVNARLSEKSLRGWRRAPKLAQRLLSAFDIALAQDQAVARRLAGLGARRVTITGSLKADAPPLPVDDRALAAFRAALGTRPMFLAASTHPGEERIVLEAMRIVLTHHPDLLSVIVPRHPARGTEIESMGAGLGFAVQRRAGGALPEAATQIYVADTLGELGLFYRVAPFAFLGGSLVPHGGQNPLEAARLGSAIVTGPHTHNFAETLSILLAAQGQGLVQTAEQLAELSLRLIGDPVTTRGFGERAKSAAESMGGALKLTIEAAEKLMVSHARA